MNSFPPFPSFAPALSPRQTGTAVLTKSERAIGTTSDFHQSWANPASIRASSVVLLESSVGNMRRLRMVSVAAQPLSKADADGCS